MDVYTYKPTFCSCEACGHEFRAGDKEPDPDTTVLCVTCERLVRLKVRTLDQLKREAENRRS